MYENARYPSPDRKNMLHIVVVRNKCKNQCDNCKIKKDDLENFVINQLKNYLFNKDMIPKLTKDLNKYIQDNEENNKSNIIKYEQRLKELETNKANIIEAITKSGFSDTFSEKLKAIEKNCSN